LTTCSDFLIHKQEKYIMPIDSETCINSKVGIKEFTLELGSLYPSILAVHCPDLQVRKEIQDLMALRRVQRVHEQYDAALETKNKVNTLASDPKWIFLIQEWAEKIQTQVAATLRSYGCEYQWLPVDSCILSSTTSIDSSLATTIEHDLRHIVPNITVLLEERHPSQLNIANAH
jgi:hypothetical protein